MEHTYSKKLKSLVLFRNLLQDEVIAALIRLDDCDGDAEELTDRYCALAAALLKNGGDLTAHVQRLVTEDDNLYVRAAAAGDGRREALRPAAERELSILQRVAELDGAAYRERAGDGTLFHWRTAPIDLAAVYRAHLADIGRRGYGVFSRYHMFLLGDDGELLPIRHPDPQRLEELFGYESEREKILRNTEALLAGRAANNVLLYGDAGTGKSSTIKAIANAYRDEGLRLIELKKNQLYRIPELIDRLADNPLKFILFLDDLTFAADDRDFCTLKAILEGGVASRGANVAIYVTSNHRHLIKETMQDRQGDEISVGDKLQEMTSLSARFGLSVTFSRPDKALYSEIVERLAREAGITLDPAVLITRAEAFAIRHGGRNPRTARQFVDLLQAGVE